MFNKNIFSERVRELRLSKNLKQIELGNILNLSMQTINGIERGRRTTTFESLCILSEYFDVSADWLLGLSDTKERR